MRRLFAILALLGCDGELQTGPSRASPWINDDLSAISDLGVAPLTPDELLLELGKARCRYDVRCGWRAASGEQACEDAALAAYPPAYSPVAAVAAGRLGFDADLARACVDVWATAGCGPIERAIADASCRAWVAERAVGQSCLANAECIDGYCQGSLQEGCDGTCAPWLASGAACDPANSLCDAARAFCATSSRTCVALAGIGDACGADALCERSLVCIGAAGSDGGATGLCRGGSGVGAPCLDYFFGYSSCDSGLYCDDSGVCVLRKIAGDPCASVDVCSDGLDCIGGVCAPFRDVGAACDATLGDPGCARDLRCSAGSCVVAGTAGDSCGAGGRCRDHLYCDGAGKCSAAVPFGATCAPPSATNDPDPCSAGACDPASHTCALSCR